MITTTVSLSHIALMVCECQDEKQGHTELWAVASGAPKLQLIYFFIYFILLLLLFF